MTDQKTVLFSHSQLVYIIHVRDLYKQFVKEGDLCFDIGACWGNMMYPLLLLESKVIAVEPNTNSCDKIHGTFRTLKDVNYVIKNVAVSDKEGEEQFYINPYAEISTLNKDWIASVTKSKRFGDDVQEWATNRKVKTTTLDKLIEEHGKPHFIKIDVEGHESKVLQGLSTPINVISFEYNIEFICDAIKCIDTLNKLGDYVYTFTSGTRMEFVSNGWLDGTTLINDLLQNPSKQVHAWGDIYALDRRLPLKDFI